MIAGLLLAAGRSRRMGGACKLVLEFEGTPLVRRTATALLQGGLRPVVAVVGASADAVAGALAPLPVHLVVNPGGAGGLAGSLVAGLEALGPECKGVAIALADLPLLTAASVRRVAEALAGGAGIAVPVFGGRRGHPVGFRLPDYLQELRALRGDAGARRLLEAHPGKVVEVPVDDEGGLVDVDTPEDWARLGPARRPDQEGGAR